VEPPGHERFVPFSDSSARDDAVQLDLPERTAQRRLFGEQVAGQRGSGSTGIALPSAVRVEVPASRKGISLRLGERIANGLGHDDTVSCAHAPGA
jgi:hypothetical protein